MYYTNHNILLFKIIKSAALLSSLHRRRRRRRRRIVIGGLIIITLCARAHPHVTTTTTHCRSAERRCPSGKQSNLQRRHTVNTERRQSSSVFHRRLVARPHQSSPAHLSTRAFIPTPPAEFEACAVYAIYGHDFVSCYRYRDPRFPVCSAVSYPPRVATTARVLSVFPPCRLFSRRENGGPKQQRC